MPLTSINRNLAGALKQVGQPVSIAGRTIDGFVSYNDQPIFEGDQAPLKGTQIVVVARNVDLDGLVSGTVVSFDGKDFRVREFSRISNGSLTKLWCRLA